jgi:hypothetical protein
MSERQLHLFRSKRQRGIRVDYSSSEFKMHCAVADTLKRWATPNWIFSHFPAGEKRTAATGARLKKMGVQAGWPDLVFLAPQGHPIQRPMFLELKRRGGKLTEAQAGFAAWCVANGCPHAVAYSYDEAVAALKRWGVLRAGVHVQ